MVGGWSEHTLVMDRESTRSWRNVEHAIGSAIAVDAPRPVLVHIAENKALDGYSKIPMVMH